MSGVRYHGSKQTLVCFSSYVCACVHFISVYMGLHAMIGLKTHCLLLSGYCIKGQNRQYEFLVLQFFKSTVACEFVIIYKVVTWFWCPFVFYTEHSPLLLKKLQNNQLMAALMTRIFSNSLFDCLTCDDCPNQTSIPQFKKKILRLCKMYFEAD